VGGLNEKGKKVETNVFINYGIREGRGINDCDVMKMIVGRDEAIRRLRICYLNISKGGIIEIG